MEKVVALYDPTPSVIPSTPPIIGKSPHLLAVYDRVRRVAPTSASVVIYGETGTGKELVAHALHAQSERSRGPLVPVNCAAIPADLAESELFGHERGAFTGATDRQLGMVELAHGGTLFLDEVNSLSLAAQAKLLRVLSEGEIRRVGGRRCIPVDVRIVAATNQRLDALVDTGTFREDLYYRLGVVEIDMPPLRQCREDIPLLANHFMMRFRAKFGRPIDRISRGAMDALRRHHWPGNIRELENTIERACVMCRGQTIVEEDLGLRPIVQTGKVFEVNDVTMPFYQARTAFEAFYLLKALEQNKWDKLRTAKALGIHRNTVMTKIEALKLREH